MNMKHLLTALLLLPAAAWAQKGFHIKGNIEGLKDSTEIRISGQNNTPIATTISRKGQFELNGELPEPQLAVLTIGKNQPLYLYIENTTITLSAPAAATAPVVKEKTTVKAAGSKTKTKVKPAAPAAPAPDLTQLKVDGSSSQVDFIQFQNAFMP
ncbi:MAG: DUF4369 domain-containing protein, partial [Sphingobacteriales bacterium]